MTFSTLDIEALKEYLRLDGDDEDRILNLILLACKSYVRGFTGLTDDKLDELDDIPVVLLTLGAEMYDNRQFTVDKDNINPVIKTILCMHSVNLV